MAAEKPNRPRLYSEEGDAQIPGYRCTTDRWEVHICDPQTRPDEHQLMIPQAREVLGTLRNCLPCIFAGA